MVTRKKHRPTLADVARLAGVSLGSASNALATPNQVKPSTLEKVQRAVAKLAYIPDGTARALASQKTLTIGAVYPTLDNPIFAHSTHSLQKTLWNNGYQLLIASLEYHSQHELAVIQSTLSRGIDGMILVGTDHNPEVFNLLHQWNIPYVLTWSTDDTEHPHCVGISNFNAGYDLGKEIIKHGHTKVAICGGDTRHNERARGRKNGIMQALKENDIHIPEEWLLQAEFSYQGGRDSLRKILALKNKPTVIAFGTDLQAIGALYEARIQGIAVPEKLSIVGFDGIAEGKHMQPSLTTVQLPAHRIGIEAANRILALINGKKLEKAAPLPHKIVVMDSLANLNPANLI